MNFFFVLIIIIFVLALSILVLWFLNMMYKYIFKRFVFLRNTNLLSAENTVFFFVLIYFWYWFTWIRNFSFFTFLAGFLCIWLAAAIAFVLSLIFYYTDISKRKRWIYFHLTLLVNLLFVYMWFDCYGGYVFTVEGERYFLRHSIAWIDVGKLLELYFRYIVMSFLCLFIKAPNKENFYLIVFFNLLKTFGLTIMVSIMSLSLKQFSRCLQYIQYESLNYFLIEVFCIVYGIIILICLYDIWDRVSDKMIKW